jgi:hypothetical protein
VAVYGLIGWNLAVKWRNRSVPISQERSASTVDRRLAERRAG